MKYDKSNPLRCFFAFEGYNSQGLALNRLKKMLPDFEWVCVGRSEIDRYAITAANALFPESAELNYGDISKIDWASVPDFDLFTYSFPCQSISVAGLQHGFAENSGTRSSLLWECRKAIKTKRPKYLLMENVKALISKKFKPDFERWLVTLSLMGYVNFYQVLNAKNYGVPQNRERVFMVSIRDDGESPQYHFPKTFNLVKRLRDILEDEVDERFFLRQEQVDRIVAHCQRKVEEGCGYKTNFTPPTELAEQSKQEKDSENTTPTLSNRIIPMAKINSSQDGIVVTADGIAKTLMVGHCNVPKVMINEKNSRTTEY